MVANILCCNVAMTLQRNLTDRHFYDAFCDIATMLQIHATILPNLFTILKYCNEIYDISFRTVIFNPHNSKTTY